MARFSVAPENSSHELSGGAGGAGGTINEQEGRLLVDDFHSLTGGDVFPDPGFARAIAGIYNYGSNEIETFVDDVSVSQSALTCP